MIIDASGTHDRRDTGRGSNVISGQRGDDGVTIDARSAAARRPGNVVAGNYIGTDVTGDHTALGNDRHGVADRSTRRDNTIGGTTAGGRNIISGNGSDGVSHRHGIGTGRQRRGNVVEGNYIGTDVTGDDGPGNTVSRRGDHDASNNTIGGTTAGGTQRHLR